MDNETSTPGRGERADDWWEDRRFYVYLGLLLLMLALGFFWHRIVISVPAGHHAVMFRRFAGGTMTARLWGEGHHVVPPWDTLTVYETRVQETTIDLPVLSKDGLEILVTVSIRFHPIVANLGYLHKEVGPNYFRRLILPEVESNLRRTIGDRTAYALYSSEGDILQELSQVSLQVKNAGTRNVRVDNVLVRRLQLPEIVREAINEKHRQEQLLLGYDFRVKREEREAERKRIEALGIRDYNRIASQISPQILRWRGIEATVALAKSPNSKVIVIGGGQDGLPIILDTRTGADSVAAPGVAAPGLEVDGLDFDALGDVGTGTLLPQMGRTRGGTDGARRRGTRRAVLPDEPPPGPDEAPREPDEAPPGPDEAPRDPAQPPRSPR